MTTPTKPKKKRNILNTPKRIRLPFNPVMVRAILAGEKTETRRMRGLEMVNKQPDRWHKDSVVNGVVTFSNSKDALIHKVKMPIIPGQSIAVAEAIRLDKKFDEYTPGQVDHGVFTASETFGTFAALNTYFPASRGRIPEWAGKIHNARFMPTRLARIELPCLSVKVERLTEILGDEAINEGAFFWARENQIKVAVHDPRETFYQLWDSINPDNGSKKNPWVFVIKFQKWGEEEQ